MGPTIQLSRKAYGIGIIAFGIQQLVRGDITANFLPDIIPHETGYSLLVYTWGILFTLSGVAMLVDWKARTVALKLRLVASLLGIMFFLWLVLLHIHRAIVDPVGNDGLEVARVCVIFGFIGTAFLLAMSAKKDRRGR